MHAFCIRILKYTKILIESKHVMYFNKVILKDIILLSELDNSFKKNQKISSKLNFMLHQIVPREV